ncbi:MAG: crossover junction endodeoxyribonuclease RuvC [Patescibacteria group bacterium]|nr:crossover junction endodeoxyribonuclease RuvC [Patescibacteria group bacterium]
MKIIGIDPGTRTTGFGVIEIERDHISLLDYGCIKTEAGLDAHVRLSQIGSDLEKLIKKWRPDEAAVEELFFAKNVKTAMSVAQARGVVLEKLNRKGVRISEYKPSEIKEIVCGNGRADKKALQKMVQLLLKLNRIPKPDDAADAIAAALCHASKIPLRENIRSQQ